MDTLEWLRAISGTLFFIEFVAYSVTAFIFYERRYRAFSAVLFDNIVISGLNAMLTIYLLDGGDLKWAWLVYSFSCVYLAITFYRVLTHDASSCQCQSSMSYGDISTTERDPPYSYYNMCIATFVTIVAGLVINLLTSQPLRWLVFVLDFAPFIFAIMFLFRAVAVVNQNQVVARPWARIAVYINLAFWDGYPFVMLLGPLFTNTISTRDEALGYVLLDFVTKHLSMALFAGYTGTKVTLDHCTQCKDWKEVRMKLSTIASSTKV